jgi:polar amino acid transport system substrate-binding protein
MKPAWSQILKYRSIVCVEMAILSTANALLCKFILASNRAIHTSSSRALSMTPRTDSLFSIDEASRSLLQAQLAPTGSLRVGLNMSNTLLITGRDNDSHQPKGVAPHLARYLAESLHVPIQYVEYARPQHVTADALQNQWDVACLAAEPARAQDIWFTPAYVEIEATYLVPRDSSVQSVDDIDQAHTRIAVPEGSAYALHLSHHLHHAQLCLAAGSLDAARELYVDQECDALAGLRPRLLEDEQVLESIRPSRILSGKFHAVQQAMGIPRVSKSVSQEDDNNENASESKEMLTVQAFLTDFIQHCRTSGLIRDWIELYGVEGKLAVVKST